MKLTSLTSLIIVLTMLQSEAQSVQIPVSVYANSADFFYKIPGTPLLAIVKDSSAGHLLVKKFTDLQGNKLKQRFLYWAIEYKGRVYFNLNYSTDLFHPLLFVPFDIQGKYSVVFIGKDSPPVVRRSGPGYGMGVERILSNESPKWGKAWIDKDGNKRRLLFIETDGIQDASETTSIGHGDYLTRSQLKELCEKNGIELPDIKVKDLPFEDVVEIIHTLNRKNQPVKRSF